MKKIFALIILLNFIFINLNAFAAPKFSARYDLSANDPAPSSIIFNDDGTSMYMTGRANPNVWEYSLTRGYDLTDVNALRTLNTLGEEPLPEGITFNNNGSKLYSIGSATGSVWEYDLINYDLNTAIVNQALPVNHANPSDIKFNNDGSKMFTVDAVAQQIEEFDLSDAYDVQSAGGSTRTYDLSSQVETAEGVEFNSDGTKMFIVDGTLNTVFSYTLSTGFLVTSAIYSESFDLSGEIQEATSITFNNDGTMMFIADGTSGDVESYTMCAYSLTETPGSCSSESEESEESEESGESGSLPDPTNDSKVVGSIDAQSQSAKNSISNSINSVSNRLSSIRQNKSNQSSQNIKLDFGNAILTSLSNELLAKNDKSFLPDNWSSWSEGSISVTKIGDSTTSSSKEIDSHGLALGFDTKLNNNDTLGFAIQYGQSDADVGSNGTNSDSKNYNLSVYRTRPLDDNHFIEGIFGIGLIETDLKRVSGANTLTGSRDGTQVFGSINYGKTLNKGEFSLTPIGRVDLGYTELDSYTETGTNALSYNKQTIESGLASLGFEINNVIKFSNSSLKPFGSLEYGLDFSNSSDAKMNYVSDSSTKYTYTKGANSNHLITSVIGFEYLTKDNLNILTSYKRTQGNESEHTDSINVSLNFKSKQETNYAMTLDGSEDLKAGFDITKNVNGFDLSFNADQSLSENSDQTAKVSLSRKF